MPSDPGLTGRIALVTGANHGIGAAIARELADHGARVVAAYLRMTPADLDSEHYPAAYGEARGAAADVMVAEVESRGGKAIGVEADLREPGAPAALFDLAEKEFGPVEILVNNASAWKADTFVPQEKDRFGRPHSAVGHASHDFVFGVDARAPAMLMSYGAAKAAMES